MGHALLSASGAYRWLNCTPSARLEEKLDDTSSVYAQEGTLAHELAELQLIYELKEITKRTYNTRVKKIRAHELFTKDMPDHVEKYTDFVMEKYAEAIGHTKDALIFLEQKLDFSTYVPKGFGTGDCIIIADGTLEIIDLKYGKGVEVSAENNPQMRLYALGALEEYGYIYDISTIKMTIAQPRLDNFSTEEIPVTKLVFWGMTTVKEAGLLAFKGDGELKAGDWCKFCKVKATCKERAYTLLAVGEKHNRQNPNLLNIEEIAEILKQADDIQSWAKDVQDHALKEARDNGVKFPGWKLVEGRSNRKYKDPDKVAKVLIKNGYEENKIYKPKEVLGITALQKEIGKKKFTTLLKDLIIKPQGKPTLALEDDKRPELNSAAADFDL
jgi:hypothetical protein